MREPHLFMHKLDSLKSLLGDALDLAQTEAFVFIALDELKQAFAQSLENKARVLIVTLGVEVAFMHQDYVVGCSALFFDVIQYFNLYFGACIIPLYCSDDFDGVVGLVFEILTLKCSAESAIS